MPQAQPLNTDPHKILAEKLAKPGEQIVSEMTPLKAHLMHMAIGVSGEAGELLDAIKKHVMYGKELDVENVIEELGDIYFYIQGIMNGLGLERDQIIQHNIRKLSKRYSAGTYSNEQAQERADKEEGQ